jgi:hypothetical protein
MMIAAMKWTLRFIGKDKAKWHKVKSTTHIRRRWQNILTKLPGFNGQARNTTRPFEAWNYLITDEILDYIVQRTNQYILIMQPNFSHKSSVKLPDKIEIKALLGVLYLAGAIRSTRQSLEELWGSDREGVEQFCLVMNQRHLKFLIRCIRFDDRTIRDERK